MTRTEAQQILDRNEAATNPNARPYSRGTWVTLLIGDEDEPSRCSFWVRSETDLIAKVSQMREHFARQGLSVRLFHNPWSDS